MNVLYILDEPSIGLHQRDNTRLIESLKRLRDQGNSLIVVEHDKDMMLAADYIVDMGPGAGRKGGKVIYSGTPKAVSYTHLDVYKRQPHAPTNARHAVRGSGIASERQLLS